MGDDRESGRAGCGPRAAERDERAGLSAGRTAREAPAETGFAAGSRIQCRRGEVLVEMLDEAEEILTASGRWARVTVVRPLSLQVGVRVERDAFGPGQPHRSMLVACEQVLAVDGRLATARSFVDGGSVRLESHRARVFHQVLLDRPGFAIADGIAAEFGRGEPEESVAFGRRERLMSLRAI